MEWVMFLLLGAVLGLVSGLYWGYKWGKATSNWGRYQVGYQHAMAERQVVSRARYEDLRDNYKRLQGQVAEREAAGKRPRERSVPWQGGGVL